MLVLGTLLGNLPFQTLGHAPYLILRSHEEVTSRRNEIRVTHVRRKRTTACRVIRLCSDYTKVLAP